MFRRLLHTSPTVRLSLATRPQRVLPYGLGQPTHETRPHLLPQPGNLTAGISAEEYFERRLTLASRLPANSIAILVGNAVRFSSGSVFYEFQQDNDFYYLTGWLEPDSVAVIQNLSEVSLHMFVPPKNPQTQLWEGERLGVEGAQDFFNADAAHANTDLAPLKLLILLADYIYWDDRDTRGKFGAFFGGAAPSPTSSRLADMVKASRATVRPLAPLVATQREVKSDCEIEVMHAAAAILSRAINKAIARVGLPQPLCRERTLAQFLEYEFVHGGCDTQAYIPVVASGANALTIHYTRNDDLLYRDETVFVDAGGKLGGYCADILRSWPNSPRGFLSPQRDIYEAVLSVNRQCIDMCHLQLGVLLHDIHLKLVSLLAAELRQLPGFGAVLESQVTALYPHYIGHHLGLDLHDVPGTSRFKPLVAGNVITIEPGLYVPQTAQWPKHFQGIGVRVEDDVVVATEPAEIVNLSSSCVKEVADIELLIRAGTVTTPGAYDELVVMDI